MVQEGQKRRNCARVEVSLRNGVESRKELDAFVELDPVAEITEVGTKEVLPDTPQPELKTAQPQPQIATRATATNRLNPERPHVSEGPSSYCNPHFLRSKWYVRKGQMQGRKSRKHAQTPAVSPAPVSKGRLPNTEREESVASLLLELSGRPCQCCAGRSEKEPKAPSKTAGKLVKTVKFTGKRSEDGEAPPSLPGDIKEWNREK